MVKLSEITQSNFFFPICQNVFYTLCPKSWETQFCGMSKGIYNKDDK